MLNQAVNGELLALQTKDAGRSAPEPGSLYIRNGPKVVRLSALRFLALVWEENSGKLA